MTQTIAEADAAELLAHPTTVKGKDTEKKMTEVKELEDITAEDVYGEQRAKLWHRIHELSAKRQLLNINMSIVLNSRIWETPDESSETNKISTMEVMNPDQLREACKETSKLDREIDLAKTMFAKTEFCGSRDGLNNLKGMLGLSDE